MPYAPVNNQTTSDDYTNVTTLKAPEGARFNIDVANAAIYYQFGEGWPDTRWDFEVFMGPGFRSFDRRKDALRVRSAAAGHPAQVTLEALTLPDLAAPTPPPNA
jgi:hypothetical protein